MSICESGHWVGTIIHPVFQSINELLGKARQYQRFLWIIPLLPFNIENVMAVQGHVDNDGLTGLQEAICSLRVIIGVTLMTEIHPDLEVISYDQDNNITGKL